MIRTRELPIGEYPLEEVSTREEPTREASKNLNLNRSDEFHRFLYLVI